MGMWQEILAPVAIMVSIYTGGTMALYAYGRATHGTVSFSKIDVVLNFSIFLVKLKDDSWHWQTTVNLCVFTNFYALLNLLMKVVIKTPNFLVKCKRKIRDFPFDVFFLQFFS